MISLPTSAPPKAETIRSMIIVSRPKVGKTEALLQLPDSLLIDLENSASIFGGTYINVDDEARQHKVGPIKVMSMIAETIKKENDNLGTFKYKFGIIDTVSTLEEYCESYATYLYTQTQQGKNFKGKSVVTELEYGAGYGWLRTAFDMVLSPFFHLFETLILTGHVRDSSISVKGAITPVTDINLTGKLKLILTSKVDAIGAMYRSDNDNSINMLSFRTTSSDVVSGARPKHLSNAEFEISKKNPATGVLTTDWKQIFPNI